MTKKVSIVKNTVLEQQFNEAVKAGEIRDIDIKHIMMLIPSNIQFIFISKSMTMNIHDMTESDFDLFLDNHIKIVKEMIANYLFIK